MLSKINFVTIIIPCRNEERFIERCLNSLIEQDYPKEKLEILILDGMSEDNTRDIIKNFTRKYSYIRLINNSKKIVSAAMNKGIEYSRGEIIIRMDAHSIYPKDYISKLIYWINKSGADNVGGRLITLPGSEKLVAKAIAFALSSPYGVGYSMFRIGAKKPIYVDTVPFGAYKREIFNKIGLFDEELIRNQDDEFNHRIIRNGGKILLVPEIVSYYFARDSLLKLFKMFFQYGYFKPLAALKLGTVITFRQFIPALFITSLIFSFFLSFITYYFKIILFFIISFYILSNLVFSFKVSIKNGINFLPYVFISYSAIHFSYGFGYLKGIWDFIIFKKIKKE